MQAKHPEARGRHHSPVLPFLSSSLSSVRGGTSGLDGGGWGGGGAGARLFFFCKSICDPRDTCEAQGRTVSVRVAGHVRELAGVTGTPRRAGRLPVPFLGLLGRRWRHGCEGLLVAREWP